MRENSGARLLAGRYRLGELLASGGMAEVYRAVDLHLDRPVAVKLPHVQPGSDPRFAERLGQEARLTSTLDHPNIVRVYDYGRAGEQPFLVMELVEGQSLATLLEGSGTLPVGQAVQVARQVLAALDHAHARGVVHGDVKPQNVLMAGDGRARLADFGIAETISASVPSGRKTVLGTKNYLAPERLEGEPASVASDLYSAGVLLYRILTGRLPTGEDSPEVTRSLTGAVGPRPPSSVRPALPRWLDAVVARAMARDPRARYPSARSMLAALEMGASAHDARTVEFFAPGPAMATPETRGRAEPAPVPRRRTSRLPLYAAAVALLLVAAAAGLMLAGTIMGPGDGSGLASNPAPPPGAQPAIPAVSPTPAPATATPSPAPTPGSEDPTQAPSLVERLRQLESQLRRDVEGLIGKERQELVKKIEDAIEKAREGKRKEAEKKLDELQRSVRELQREGKLSSDLADRLVAQIRAIVDQPR